MSDDRPPETPTPPPPSASPERAASTPPPLPTVELASLSIAYNTVRPSGWVVPVSVSPWAVAAGYAGLFAFVVLPGPIALVLSLIAFRELRTNPHLTGKGRAVFGFITGLAATILLTVVIVLAIFGR
jgi:hypothetical protein